MRRKVIVRGPALSRSGYGEQCRFALRALRSREDLFDIYLIATGWGQTGWICLDTEERRWLDSLIERTNTYLRERKEQQHAPGFDISLQVTIPNEWEQIAKENVGYTAGIETTSISPAWIEKSRIVDRIITISKHSKDVFQSTSYSAKDQSGNMIDKSFKCTTPVEVVHYPVRDYSSVSLDLELDTDFNFLTVAQWGWRKNIKNTVQWFVEQFIDQKVGLVVKANIANDSTPDRLDSFHNLASLLTQYKDRKCKVYLLHGSMSDEEIHALYKHPKIKAYVTLTHGEGFGLPIFEAAYSGMPVIAPAWSGQNDYLHMPYKNKKGRRIKQKPMFAKVEFEMKQVPKEAVWKDVIEEASGCCYPQQGSYKMRLRDVHKNYEQYQKQALKLQGWIRETFTEQKMYERFVNTFLGGSKEQAEWTSQLDGLEIL